MEKAYVTLSTKSWHYQLMKLVLGKATPTPQNMHNLCPYFWLLVFSLLTCIVVVPLRLLFRALNFVANVIDKIIEQTLIIPVADSWEEKLTDLDVYQIWNHNEQINKTYRKIYGYDKTGADKNKFVADWFLKKYGKPAMTPVDPDNLWKGYNSTPEFGDWILKNNEELAKAYREKTKEEASKSYKKSYDERLEDFRDYVGESNIDRLWEETAFVNDMFETFNMPLYREGYLAPLFFGSALNNFGVLELLETFLEIAPCPVAIRASERIVEPYEEQLTGFVFKIHANLDPNHRDRIAFMRICSGRFERNKFYFHTRSEKRLRFSSPASFMANNKSIVEEAYPGDVIGLYDSGNFKIGDTLTEGEILHFEGVPSFSPEILREVINLDPLKTKQLEKGVRQMTDEGVAQLFVQQPGNRKIIGTVGELQYEVIKFRLEHEYGAKCNFAHLPFVKACWITSDNRKEMDSFFSRKSSAIAYDKENNPVFFAESEWILKTAMENFPSITFHKTSEFKIRRNGRSLIAAG